VICGAKICYLLAFCKIYSFNRLKPEDPLKGGNIMEFKELVMTRRSCRAFESSDVTDEQVATILEAGQWAPSPLNLQPWEFIVVTDPAVKTQIRAVAEEARQRVVDGGGPGWAGKYGVSFIEDAPVLIVVVCDPGKGGLGNFFNQRHGAMQAASACVQNMMLAAADMGFDTLWFTFFDPANLAGGLKIPENLEIAGVIPVGKPAGSTDAPPRKALKVYRDYYGNTE
jgi:nitroreductase